MAEQHRKEVAEDTKYNGDPATLTLTPLALVSTGVSSGVTIDGVPVLDTCLLEEYLESGMLEFIFENPGSAAREKITLYQNQHEAEANLQVYVSSPPRERLRQLRTKKIRGHSRDWGLGATFYEHLKVSEYGTLTEMQKAVELVRREWEKNCSGKLDL